MDLVVKLFVEEEEEEVELSVEEKVEGVELSVEEEIESWLFLSVFSFNPFMYISSNLFYLVFVF